MESVQISPNRESKSATNLVHCQSARQQEKSGTVKTAAGLPPIQEILTERLSARDEKPGERGGVDSAYLKHWKVSTNICGVVKSVYNKTFLAHSFCFSDTFRSEKILQGIMWSLKLIFYVYLPCYLIHCASGAPGIFASGDGEIEFSEFTVPCDTCLKEIKARLRLPNHPHCNEVARLTECFESCTPSSDREGVKSLQLLTLTSSILTTLRSRDCEVFEENAPGCNEGILSCLDFVVQKSFPNSQRINGINCKDEAMASLLQCTGNTPDCEWRSHIEMIASRGKRSVCSATDKCMAGGLIFVASPGCEGFKMVGLNNLSSLDAMPVQRTAPGTKFDVRICGLQHAAAVNC